MRSIKTSEDLALAILELEQLQAVQEQLIKDQMEIATRALQPEQLIKSAITGAVGMVNWRNVLVESATLVGAHLLTSIKKQDPGATSRTPVGNVLEIAARNFPLLQSIIRKWSKSSSHSAE